MAPSFGAASVGHDEVALVAQLVVALLAFDL
jgi:hypothetical protein